MASPVERAKVWFAEQRTARPWLDHVVRMQQHYSSVQGSSQAGAVTYFGFLSFFPLLALAFFAVGLVARFYPEGQADLVDAISGVFPGMIGSGEGQIAIEDFESAAGAAGVIGLVGVLYSGLGWLSGLRTSLQVVFQEPAKEQPSFVFGKLRDLTALVTIGAILFTSVTISSVISNSSAAVLDLVGLGTELAWLLRLLTVVVGVLASSLLFSAIFRLLTKPDIPRLDLWRGALLGAVGFEVLKQVAGLLLASTRGQPAFQAFGIALILVVWINYFSRVVVYAAAWAHTSTSARLRREQAAAEEEARVAALRVDLDKDEEEPGLTTSQAAARSFALGAGVVAGAVAFARHERNRG